MKPRNLTDQQRRLIEMDMAGATDAAIAEALGIHTGTVRAKRAAIRRGMKKGAYTDLPAIPATMDLFCASDLPAIADRTPTPDLIEKRRKLDHHINQSRLDGNPYKNHVARMNKRWAAEILEQMGGLAAAW
ncbi:MAG: hypothetical protein HYZ18_14080 [Pseudogulbenkiania sp.]|nr:hypothetical protein [Pseudogulbenkiania sp.]